MNDDRIKEYEMTIKLLKLDVIHLTEDRNHWRDRFVETDESAIKGMLLATLVCIPLGAVIGVMLYNFFGGMV